MIESLESLQQSRKHLYASLLPMAAKSKAEEQPIWPVSLDHCFARIILDNAVGKTVPWPAVLKAPAYKNMTADQLRDAISLGNEILCGSRSLVELNERSLVLRNKSKNGTGILKRGANGREGEVEDEDGSVRKKPRTTPPINAPRNATQPDASPTTSSFDISVLDSVQDMTPFRRSVLAQIYKIPSGKWSTYRAISTSLASSPRAVGNALRNNPYAPHIPCHRVLASDGSIGGFGGHWGADGRFAVEKKQLLRLEGVKFDGRGKAVGKPFMFPDASTANMQEKKPKIREQKVGVK